MQKYSEQLPHGIIESCMHFLQCERGSSLPRGFGKMRGHKKRKDTYCFPVQATTGNRTIPFYLLDG
ncbi:hypothetical protein LEMLEM_LOCUS13016 [Lemmus lemmus]